MIAIKVFHTIVWAFFAGCILAIPFASWRGDHILAGWLIAVVLVEVGILVINRWSCPLTSLAGRYTQAREDNFDIYLPVWLARYNKLIFGSLFVAAIVFAGVRWAFAA